MTKGKCSTCEVELDSTTACPFTLKRGCGDCRSCRNDKRNKRRSGNPEERERDCSRQRRNYHALSKEERLDKSLHDKYGVDLEYFLSKFQLQNKRCAICKCELQLFVDRSDFRRACLDHDHETKKIRDILCTRCNCLLGYAKDSLKILEDALAYLKRHAGDSTNQIAPST